MMEVSSFPHKSDPKLHHSAGVLSRMFAGGADGKKPTTLIRRYEMVRNQLTLEIKESIRRFVEDIKQLARRIALPRKVDDEYSETVLGLAGPLRFIIVCTSLCNVDRAMIMSLCG